MTISDYVADLRAATPSNAAELAVPDQMELRQSLRSMETRMQQAVSRCVQLCRQRLMPLTGSRVLQNPVNYIQDRRLILDMRQKQLTSAAERQIAVNKQKLVKLAAGMDAMSPLKVLARGYSVTKDAGGRVLADAASVSPGDLISVRLCSGSLEAAVIKTGGEHDGEAEKL